MKREPRVKPVPMDPKKAIILAGIFAGTNTGLPLPKRHEVLRAKEAKLRDPESAFLFFYEGHMESEEMLKCFEAEWKSWHKQFIKMPDAYVQEVWPEHNQVYEGQGWWKNIPTLKLQERLAQLEKSTRQNSVQLAEWVEINLELEARKSTAG